MFIAGMPIPKIATKVFISILNHLLSKKLF